MAVILHQNAKIGNELITNCLVINGFLILNCQNSICLSCQSIHLPISISFVVYFNSCLVMNLTVAILNSVSQSNVRSQYIFMFCVFLLLFDFISSRNINLQIN